MVPISFVRSFPNLRNQILAAPFKHIWKIAGSFSVDQFKTSAASLKLVMNSSGSWSLAPENPSNLKGRDSSFTPCEKEDCWVKPWSNLG